MVFLSLVKTKVDSIMVLIIYLELWRAIQIIWGIFQRIGIRKLNGLYMIFLV